MFHIHTVIELIRYTEQNIGYLIAGKVSACLDLLGIDNPDMLEQLTELCAYIIWHRREHIGLRSPVYQLAVSRYSVANRYLPLAEHICATHQSMHLEIADYNVGPGKALAGLKRRLDGSRLSATIHAYDIEPTVPKMWPTIIRDIAFTPRDITAPTESLRMYDYGMIGYIDYYLNLDQVVRMLVYRLLEAKYLFYTPLYKTQREGEVVVHSLLCQLDNQGEIRTAELSSTQSAEI